LILSYTFLETKQTGFPGILPELKPAVSNAVFAYKKNPSVITVIELSFFKNVRPIMMLFDLSATNPQSVFFLKPAPLLR